MGRSLGGDVRVGGWDPGRVVAGRAVGLRSPGGVTAGRVGVVGATRCFLFLRVGRRYVRRERCFWSTPWRFGSRSRVFRHCFLPPRLHPVHACPLAKQGHPARFAVGREQHVLFGEQLQQAGLDASRVAFGCFVGRRGVVRTGEGWGVGVFFRLCVTRVHGGSSVGSAFGIGILVGSAMVLSRSNASDYGVLKMHRSSPSEDWLS